MVAGWSTGAMDALTFTRGLSRTCLLPPWQELLADTYDFAIDLGRLAKFGIIGSDRGIAHNRAICTLVEEFSAVPGCAGNVRIAARLFFSGVGRPGT